MNTETTALLIRTLTELLEAHESLHASVLDHRGALSRADRTGIASAIREQEACIHRIREIDQRRRSIFGQSISVQDLAATLPESPRRVVLELGARLRETIERVRDAQQVVAVASQSLLTHMEGMLQQVSARLNHSGTYGRMGRIDCGATVVSGIDLTR